LFFLSHTAEVRKDVSGQFHNAICCGDIEERVKVLRSVGQGQPFHGVVVELGYLHG